MLSAWRRDRRRARKLHVLIQFDIYDRDRGKSGGYRTIIFFRWGERAVFAYGFAKSGRANIDDDEEKQFKEAARHVLQLTDNQIEALVKNGDFVEARYEQEISK